MEADAGKTGGTVERLLIEHGLIEQNTGPLGKIALQDVRYGYQIHLLALRLRIVLCVISFQVYSVCTTLKLVYPR